MRRLDNFRARVFKAVPVSLNTAERTSGETEALIVFTFDLLLHNCTIKAKLAHHIVQHLLLWPRRFARTGWRQLLPLDDVGVRRSFTPSVQRGMNNLLACNPKNSVVANIHSCTFKVTPRRLWSFDGLIFEFKFLLLLTRLF